MSRAWSTGTTDLDRKGEEQELLVNILDHKVFVFLPNKEVGGNLSAIVAMKLMEMWINGS